MSKAAEQVKIRELKDDDWDTVRSIYAAGIATGQATFETETPSWEHWSSSHLPTPRLAAVSEERVVGWAALTRVSSRTVYCGVAEVSVYVAPGYQGRGIGRALLEALITHSQRCGLWTLQASIFPENIASISVHQACGFREVGRRERIAQRDGRWRDTLLFERRSTIVGND